jgi:plastocyanin
MGRRTVLVVAMLALVAAGCGKSSTTTTTSSAGGITVETSPNTTQFNGAFTSFFPNKLTVHPGETVTFKLTHFSGEPHTITFGTLVNTAATKADALGANATVPQLDALDAGPEMSKLPDVFFHKPPQGPPTPNQSAAQACDQATGVPPNNLAGGAPACANKTLSDFNGTESFYNSGLLFSDDATFKLKLSSAIKPGKYAFMCMIHRAGMRGWLTVAPQSQAADSASDVKARGDAEFQALLGKLTPLQSQLAAATASAALGGAGSDSIPGGIIAEWGPKKLTIHKGDTVTWKVFSFHNIALNPPEGDVGAVTKGPNGSVQFNGPVVAATNSVGQAPPITLFFPPPPNAGPLTIDGGPWDGKAFRNSGLLGSISPEILTYKTTFTTAGTYSLRCLIHPDMKGTVTVE